MIPLAKVVKPWGLSGEVSVFVFSRDLDTFLSYRHFFFDQSDESSSVKVISARLISKKVVLSLSCSQSIEEAEKLRGFTLYLPREEIFTSVEKKSKQTFLVSDFLGLEVSIETGNESDKESDKETGNDPDKKSGGKSEGKSVKESGERSEGKSEKPKKRSFSGKITAYYDAGVSGVFEISSGESGENSFLIPAELAYFKDVDLEKKSATIVNTSELLLPDL